MFKIGIIGSENSHAAAFMNIFQSDPAYSDIKVVGVGGIDAECNKKLYEEFKLDFIADKPEDMLGKVDAVMITARDGIYHAPYARPFLDDKLPMFIDKPFTVDQNEAVEFAQEAKKRGVLLTGGSSLKNCYDILMLKNEVQKDRSAVHGGTIIAPLNMNNPYSGFFFYSSHLAEMSLTVFGYDPEEITAFENNGNVTAVCRYKDFDVANLFMNGCYKYFGQVVTKDRVYSRDVDESLIYKHECDEFVRMLRKSEMPRSYEELVAPVFYLNAIKQSYEKNRTVKIDKFKI